MAMSRTFEKNRREHKREDVLIKVHLGDEKDARAVYATDLSKGGLFVATKSKLGVGQALDVTLVHPLTHATLKMACKVANERTDGQGRLRGYGLKFTAFSKGVQAELELFVEGVVALDPDEEIELVEVSDKAPPPAPPPAPAKALKRSKTQKLIRQAKELLDEGNLVGAVHVLSRATAIDPKDEAVWAALREIEGRIKLKDAAEDELAIEVDLSELEEPAPVEKTDQRKCKLLYEAARDCYSTKEVDAAIDYLHGALEANPSFVPARCALAQILLEEKDDRAGAVDQCKKVLKAEPKNDRALALLEIASSSKAG